ncbi:tissue-type plasminogen activator-like [Leptidea sinapis]|uniref:tissue-type plasminogen activator-like n=1 Tax=Leptidea sinapis TaxID=189913 RepID=UPI00213BB4AA|nr:tissue-type plasminogen activator-like [Leptidea sinapis]
MKKNLIILLTGLFAQNVVSQEDYEIKRGTYPFMAFIYYTDEKLVDSNGDRVMHAGILLKPEWLLSSSLESDQVPLAFPQKTLMARLGSVAIDSSLSLNDDDGEQEREIIEVIRPYNFTVETWWYSDISLLKTLTPFNITMAVKTTSMSPRSTDLVDKKCFILLYMRKNSTEKLLTHMAVNVLPATIETCGDKFREGKMICANDVDKKTDTSDSKFCSGNSGGPLLCYTEPVGLQTYINNCDVPHLYHIFSGWTDFIKCAIQDECHEDQCSAVCTAINKDPNESSTAVATEQAKVMLMEYPHKEIKEDTPAVTNFGNESDESNAAQETSYETPTVTNARVEEVTTSTSTTTTTQETAMMEDGSTSETIVAQESESTSLSSVAETIERRTNPEARQLPKKTRSGAFVFTPCISKILVILFSLLY